MEHRTVGRDTTFVAIVPARGGSKGIPRKNLVQLCGRTLLDYTAQAALASQFLNRVVLSTDDEEIAETGRSLGLEVPFIRPAPLAGDGTPMIAVLRHAVDQLGISNEVDGVVLLQPTSPMRTAAHIDAAMNIHIRTQAATVVSVTEVPHHHNPVSLMIMRRDRLFPFMEGPLITQRQDKPEVYARNGPAVLVVRPEVIRDGLLYGDPTVGYVMSREDSIDIDDEFDRSLAECLLARREQG